MRKSLLPRFLAMTSLCLGLTIAPGAGPCAQEISIGGFVGEPSGFNLRYTGDDAAFMFTAGWSTRRDEGPDVSASFLPLGFHPKLSQNMSTVFDLGVGARVTFLEHTEFSIILPAGLTLGFPHPSFRHEIFFNAGPSFALSPETTTSLYAFAGYRYRL
jgi:hypothetical protein